MKSKIIAALAIALISGCSTTGGSLMPSVPGISTISEGPGADRKRVAGAIISAMNGGLIGGTVGQGLSEIEKRNALEAEYHALEYTPSGQVVAWKGDSADRSGEVSAAQPYRVGSQDCRQYVQTVNVGGPVRSARGTACRNSDGSWTPLT